MDSIRWVCAVSLALLPSSLALAQGEPARHRERGEAVLQAGQLDRARAELNEALRLNPSDAAALHARAMLELRTGHNREAVADAGAAIRLAPGLAGAYGVRAVAYDRLGDREHALADYTESIRLHPTATKYLLRGRCQWLLRRHDRAIADCTEALRLEPDNVEALALRGAVYQERGQHGQAAADYRQAQRLTANPAAAGVRGAGPARRELP